MLTTNSFDMGKYVVQILHSLEKHFEEIALDEEKETIEIDKKFEEFMEPLKGNVSYIDILKSLALIMAENEVDTLTNCDEALKKRIQIRLELTVRQRVTKAFAKSKFCFLNF